MSNLFIIGNGFDLSHNLKTSFNDFKIYMTKHAKKNVYSISLPDAILGDISEVYGFLTSLINNTVRKEDWCDFEEALGKFKYNSYFESTLLEFDEEDMIDGEALFMGYHQSNLAQELSLSISYINVFFSNWVKTISIDCYKRDSFCKYFHEDDLFLTFNYTETLEKIYKIREKNICHIHGTSASEIVIGHGEERSPYENEYKDLNGAVDELDNIFNSLKKDSQKCYDINKKFFSQITSQNITDIFSFGFSFSKPDLFYLRKLFEAIDTKNLVWHLSQYDEQHGRNEVFKSILRDNGFIGKFGELMSIQ